MKRPNYYGNNITPSKALQFILNNENDSEERASKLIHLCVWNELLNGFDFWNKQYDNICEGDDLDHEAYIILTELLRMETEESINNETV